MQDGNIHCHIDNLSRRNGSEGARIAVASAAYVSGQRLWSDVEQRVVDFGMPSGELDDIIDKGVAFRTSGCPGKFAEDISACDRPYGDSPPSNIASYPFQPEAADLRKIRSQLDREKPGEAYVPGEEMEEFVQ